MLRKVGELWIERKEDDKKLVMILKKEGYEICWNDVYGSDGNEYTIMEEVKE